MMHKTTRYFLIITFMLWHNMQDARDKAVAERVQLQNTPPLTLQLQACSISILS